VNLFKHTKHVYTPANPNLLHELEKLTAGFNQRLAVGITKATGNMSCAYAFAFIALLGFPALSAWLGSVVALYILWLSSEFIQLVMLPILSVGQQVLGRHQELIAEEQFNFVEKTYHDIEEIIQHLSKQDEELLRQSSMLLELLQKSTKP
jgi:hypothetical protein